MRKYIRVRNESVIEEPGILDVVMKYVEIRRKAIGEGVVLEQD